MGYLSPRPGITKFVPVLTHRTRFPNCMTKWWLYSSLSFTHKLVLLANREIVIKGNTKIVTLFKETEGGGSSKTSGCRQGELLISTTSFAKLLVSVNVLKKALKVVITTIQKQLIYKYLTEKDSFSTVSNKLIMSYGISYHLEIVVILIFNISKKIRPS